MLSSFVLTYNSVFLIVLANKMKIPLSIITLAYNEADNLKILIPRLQEVADALSIPYEIIVIDGQSKDNTVEVAQRLGARVFVQEQPGYGYAFHLAFREARGEYVLNVDADCSHNPKFIKTLWERHAPNRLVIASRYVRQGGATMPLFRLILSHILNSVYLRAFSLPYRDLSSGFRLYHAKTMEPILKTRTGRDFDVLLEVLLKLHVCRVEIIEVPFLYEPRLHGSSTVHLVKFGASYAKTFFSARRWRKEVSDCAHQGEQS